MVSYQSEGVDLPPLDYARISRWLVEIASDYGRRVGEVVYRFCSDEVILEVNRGFLEHDYYTDIITFDYTIDRKIGGDILISLDTVRTNAESLGVDYEEELRRVIAHGVLHLCGLKDKTERERVGMEAAENNALAKYNSI